MMVGDEDSIAAVLNRLRRDRTQRSSRAATAQTSSPKHKSIKYGHALMRPLYYYSEAATPSSRMSYPK